MLKRFFKNGSDQSLLNAERLLVIMTLGILVVLVWLQYTNSQARNRDNQRRVDLYTLQLSVQKYFALNGKYPTSLTLLSGISPSACQDPTGNGTCADPDYGYIAFAAGTQPAVGKPSDCNNLKVACTNYLLTSNHMETTLNPYVVTNN